MKKTLIVISGPSGSGKSTLIKYALRQKGNIELSISCTTRTPRKNEIDGKDYYFISHNKFQQLIEQQKFLEYTFCFGNYYGTLKEEIDRILCAHDICLLDVDCNGVKTISDHYKNSISILILPPSFDELKKRLMIRNTENADSIKHRILSYKQSLLEKEKYNYVLINNELELAQREFLTIIDKVSL